MPEVKIKVSGAILKGHPKALIDAALTEAKERVAQVGFDLVHQRLQRVLRNPTGYYESRVAIERSGDNFKITDSNVIYGPWLEGTGSRNQTSRFKGYHTFRTIQNRLNREKSAIIAPVFDKLVRDLNR